MIKLLRVDHRLLHGQVVFKWLNFLKVNCILIANDGVAKDDLRISALRMAKPESCKLVIKNLDDSIKSILSGVTDKYDLLIITESLEDAYYLAKRIPLIKYINLGGNKLERGKKQVSKAFFVSENDIKLINELNLEGVKMEIKMVPEDKAENIMNLI